MDNRQVYAVAFFRIYVHQNLYLFLRPASERHLTAARVKTSVIKLWLHITHWPFLSCLQKIWHKNKGRYKEIFT
jgi:hypothetical protein